MDVISIMKSVEVSCQKCGQRLIAPSQLGDLILTCPTCKYRWTEFYTLKNNKSDTVSSTAASTVADIPWAYFSRPTPLVAKPTISLTSQTSDLKRHLSVASNSTEPERKDEICPICFGDGGVRGGCYKCDGSGWITHSARIRAFSNTLPQSVGRSDTSRISNANYVGINPGAHYRDRDGRMGSYPDHDDYSEDGGA